MDVDAYRARVEQFIGAIEREYVLHLSGRKTSFDIEPIYDRSKEHLGTTDSMVITVRRLYIRAARALQEEGRLPANIDNVSAPN